MNLRTFLIPHFLLLPTSFTFQVEISLLPSRFFYFYCINNYMDSTLGFAFHVLLFLVDCAISLSFIFVFVVIYPFVILSEVWEYKCSEFLHFLYCLYFDQHLECNFASYGIQVLKSCSPFFHLIFALACLAPLSTAPRLITDYFIRLPSSSIHVSTLGFRHPDSALFPAVFWLYLWFLSSHYRANPSTFIFQEQFKNS